MKRKNSMKSLIKIACCTLAMSFCTTNFTMLRSLTRPTSQQTAQKTTQATRIFTSRAPTTTKATSRLTTWWNTVKTQTGNTFAQLKNMFYSKAPTLTTPAFIEKFARENKTDFEYALDAIKFAREKLGLNENECTPSQQELACLLNVTSLEGVDEFLIDKRKQILKSIGCSDEIIDNFLSTLKKNKANLNITRENILIHINIRLAALKKIAAALGTHPGNLLYPEMPPFYSFNDLKSFVAGHEFGHFLECHAEEEKLIKDILAQQVPIYIAQHSQPNDINNVESFNNKVSHISDTITKNLKALRELEADIATAKMDPDIGKVIYEELHTLINTEKAMAEQSSYLLKIPFFSKLHSEKPHSPTNMSLKDKYALIKKILELHEFTPNQTKE